MSNKKVKILITPKYLTIIITKREAVMGNTAKEVPVVKPPNKLLSSSESNVVFTKEELRESVLATLGVNAAAIIHEAKQPLQSIRAHLQLLERQLSKSNFDSLQQQQRFALLYDEIGRINSLLSQFMLMAAERKEHRQRIELSQIGTDMSMLLRSVAILRNVEIVENYKQGVYCLCDGQQIRQIVLNLLSNAIDASNENGRIIISVNQTDNWAELSVQDNGCGIAPENIEKLFKPFFTTKENGNGIGLPMSLQIAKEHGGDIKISSKLGQGSIFKLLLPLD